jgi:hypothetical protein
MKFNMMCWLVREQLYRTGYRRLMWWQFGDSLLGAFAEVWVLGLMLVFGVTGNYGNSIVFFGVWCVTTLLLWREQRQPTRFSLALLRFVVWVIVIILICGVVESMLGAGAFVNVGVALLLGLPLLVWRAVVSARHLLHIAQAAATQDMPSKRS